VTPCARVGSYQGFEGTYRLHLQGEINAMKWARAVSHVRIDLISNVLENLCFHQLMIMEAADSETLDITSILTWQSKFWFMVVYFLIYLITLRPL
jgi:type VI protein secretion system component VasF